MTSASPTVHDRPTDPPTPLFVDAVPFRAWARQLVTDSGLGWPVIAVAAGVKVRDLRTLLTCDPNDTIPQPLAARLYALDRHHLRDLVKMPGDRSRLRHHLLALGWFGFTVEQVVELTGINARRVILLTGGAAAPCTAVEQYCAQAIVEMCELDAVSLPRVTTRAAV